MKILLIIISISSLIQAQETGGTCKNCDKPDPVVENEQDTKKASFPPCGACNSLVTSFTSQLVKSEDDFDKIKRKTCNDVSRGAFQCKENLKKWSKYLEEWFKESNNSREALKEWLCVKTLQVCCSDNHFGADCMPCNKIGKYLYHSHWPKSSSE